ncbi:histidine kinase [Herbiconiux moechotypicola]|uniref:histidine kinase n=1 Tax=Herbiconiux moechotypicola TaxID=637393 RepID=A0ABN3E141_9MICO|nr:histidine kinase [Herbiconiux moechotypicola]MCS5731100.1 histidine kinase [Herbiconiux moechotypicola]
MDRGARRTRGHPAHPERRLTTTPGPLTGPSSATSAPAAQPAGADDLRLPKPPGFIRSFFNRHPWLLDGFIAAGIGLPMLVYALVTLARSAFGDSPFGGEAIRSSPYFGLVLLYLAAAVTVGMLFRRHVPSVTAAICVIALFASSTTAQQIAGLPMMIALYALAVYRSTRSAWIWTAVATGVGIVSLVLQVPTDLATIVGYGLLNGLLLVIATLVGITFGNRRRYITALLDRAAQLARERDQRAQLAASAERTRIAREMHDIVAHSLTVIVALSDGAEASIERNPETAREAVRQTAVTARRALADMRRSLGVLTEPGSGTGEGGADAGGTGGPGAADARTASAEGLAPQPRLDDLGELVQSYRAAGLPVRFTVTGEPRGDALLQLTVYRVVQEALTNALRYAVQVTRVDVTIGFAAAGVTIEVADDGVDPARGAGSAGSGRGLVGMRERVATLGGTVTAGPAGGRGWTVRAELPGAHDSEETSA